MLFLFLWSLVMSLSFVLQAERVAVLDDVSDVYGCDSDSVQSVLKDPALCTDVAVDGGVAKGVVDATGEVVKDSSLGCVLKEEVKSDVAVGICCEGAKKGVKRRLFDSVSAVDHVQSKVHLKVGGGVV